MSLSVKKQKTTSSSKAGPSRTTSRAESSKTGLPDAMDIDQNVEGSGGSEIGDSEPSEDEDDASNGSSDGTADTDTEIANAQQPSKSKQTLSMLAPV